MTDNAMWYLYSQLSDCCQEHYQWNYDECIGSSNKPYSALFYPDWETGINVGCKNGGGQPVVRCLEVIISMVIPTQLTLILASTSSSSQYMNSAPEIWLRPTLEDCCVSYYNDIFDDCMAAGGTSTGTTGTSGSGSGLYYADWSNGAHVCINDGELRLLSSEIATSVSLNILTPGSSYLFSLSYTKVVSQHI